MTSHEEVIKKLGIKYHIGSYGIQFLPRDPNGHVYRLFQLIPLDGWTFDSHEIIEAMANDPDLSISYSQPSEAEQKADNER